MSGGVYQILNTVNGKRYIGSTSSFARRLKRHKHDLLEGSHHSRALQRAWDKYGEAAFEFEKMLICASANTQFFEQRAIERYKPEYNIAKNATAPMLGRNHSPATRAKMSALLVGNTRTKGHKQTPEHKQNISVATSGRVRTAEHRINNAAPRIGRPLPLETRNRIGAAQLGKKRGPMSAEQKIKLSISLRASGARRKSVNG